MSNPAYQKRNPSAISRDLTSILAVAGLLLFSWFNLSAVQSAQAEQTNPAATSWIDDDNVSVRLISATNATGMADANSPLIFGLEFQLAENWKVYWRSPGDAGYPPTPDWALSKNVSRADIQWPAPVRFSILGFETLGYKHEVVYPISVIPERPGEAVKLAGEVDFLACADICPTRALHVNDDGELVLADYYCIKCGACMQICPVKPEVEEYEAQVEAYGVTKTVQETRITNVDDLPVYVERWRVQHAPVVSAAWTAALLRLADDKAGMVEIDRKRALKRRDLITALKGGHEIAE